MSIYMQAYTLPTRAMCTVCNKEMEENSKVYGHQKSHKDLRITCFVHEKCLILKVGDKGSIPCPGLCQKKVNCSALYSWQQLVTINKSIFIRNCLLPSLTIDFLALISAIVMPRIFPYTHKLDNFNAVKVLVGGAYVSWSFFLGLNIDKMDRLKVSALIAAAGFVSCVLSFNTKRTFSAYLLSSFVTATPVLLSTFGKTYLDVKLHAKIL